MDHLIFSMHKMDPYEMFLKIYKIMNGKNYVVGIECLNIKRQVSADEMRKHVNLDYLYEYFFAETKYYNEKRVTPEEATKLRLLFWMNLEVYKNL